LIELLLDVAAEVVHLWDVPNVQAEAARRIADLAIPA
jgi:hypothetical protein